MARRSDPDTLTKPVTADPEPDADTTAAPEPAPAVPSLTLAGRPAAFRELEGRDEWDVGAAATRGQWLLEERFPDLVGVDIKEAARAKHPDIPRFIDMRHSLILIWPYLIGAWAGPGAPPTIAELERARSAELRACLAEVARLNPDVPELERFLPGGVANPN